MSVKNPNWARDELILALELFFRHNPSHINSSHPEVIKLSNILNKLPIHTIKPDAHKFRNPNGVYMKLNNFLRYDPEYKGVGLKKGGKLEKIIWDEFYNDRERLKNIACNIIEGIDVVEEIIDDSSQDDENEFMEGRILYRIHRMRERNGNIIKIVKNIARKNGKLKCEVCGFDFYEKYGEVGKDYIEGHHTMPISEYKGIISTKVEDIALVCSNCHRMLHRRRPWITKEELTKLILKK